MDRFEQAIAYIRNSSSNTSIDDHTKLQFYALYKSATVGPCSRFGGSQPWAFQLEARAKWDAWDQLGEMSAETAQKLYVRLLDRTVPNWDRNDTE